ncbi:MAG TPA: MarR family transcriptional regulator [Spirochaetia bacterium]|nr:MarR family transcriptional regulator [Spirochaetia bacterium]
MDGIRLMTMVQSLWRKRASAALEGFGITLSQFLLIQLARRRGAIRPSEAAEELASDRPTLTLVARKCVARGWLSRLRVKLDRRAHRLRLTGLGEELPGRIEAARVLSPEVLGDPLDVLDSEERGQFLRALDKVHRRARDLF